MTYIVWFTTISGRDGDKTFATLADAEREFDDKKSHPNTIEVVILDAEGEPVPGYLWLHSEA